MTAGFVGTMAGRPAGTTSSLLGLIPTFVDVVALPFLTDYSDPDTLLTIGGIPGVGYAIPDAFANFPWVAIHYPAYDEEFRDYEWSTTFVFLELSDDDRSVPRVVGVHRQYLVHALRPGYLQQLPVVRARYADNVGEPDTG